MTDNDLRAWLDTKLADPAWVAKMKRRSDEADAQMREMGLLPSRATDRRFSGLPADRPAEPQP